MAEATIWIASLAGLVAASVGAWRWGYEEWRKQPAVDGDLVVTVVPGPNKTAFVRVDSVWNNKSLLPIYLNPNECVIRFHELDSLRPGQAVRNEIASVLEIYPIENVKYLCWSREQKGVYRQSRFCSRTECTR